MRSSTQGSTARSWLHAGACEYQKPDKRRGADDRKPEIIRIRWANQASIRTSYEKDDALGSAAQRASLLTTRLPIAELFKGGTCLKKCFFETYRSRRRLDSTLHDESHLDEASPERMFAETGEWIYEQSGLAMPADRQDLRYRRQSRAGTRTAKARSAIVAPVTNRGGRPRA